MVIKEARWTMFASVREIRNIPPTQEALTEHTKRALYKKGYHWNSSLIPGLAPPYPSSWGWWKDEEEC